MQIVRDALVAADAYVDSPRRSTQTTTARSSSDELHIATVVAGYEGGRYAPERVGAHGVAV